MSKWYNGTNEIISAGGNSSNIFSSNATPHYWDPPLLVVVTVPDVVKSGVNRRTSGVVLLRWNHTGLGNVCRPNSPLSIQYVYNEPEPAATDQVGN